MPASKTILLVEDEMLIAMDIEATLIELGYDVAIATDVGEALDAIDRQSFSLAILDFRVRSGDTEPVARRLRERGVAFILCSGSASAKELGEMFANVPFLPKPFTSDSLVQVVGELERFPDASRH